MSKKPMKPHTIRIAETLWKAALTRADEKGETVSEAVRRYLERYIR